MDAISYSYADKQAKRIKKFINNPDSDSGIVTVPKVIGAGESVTIPAGRVAVLPNVQIDGVLNIENGGEVFIPSGATFGDLDQRIDTLDSTTVKTTGNQTIAGIKTFSSTVVGNITGNSGTATTLSTNRNNFRGSTESAVVGELMWKHYGNGHTIFDASNSTTPTGATKNNTNPDIAWNPTCPTLMGYNGIETFGVRVDSSRYADQLKTAEGSAPSYACRAWVNFNASGTVAIRASGNVSSITDNGVGKYTVNFTTAMPDANYSIVGTASVAGYSGTNSPLILTEGLAASNTYSLKTQSAIAVFTINNEQDVAYDAFSANVSIFR